MTLVNEIIDKTKMARNLLWEIEDIIGDIDEDDRNVDDLIDILDKIRQKSEEVDDLLNDIAGR